MKNPENSRILITGAARNVGKTISHLFEVFEKAFEDFKQINYLIVESYSDDNTLEKLQKLSNVTNRLELITLDENKINYSATRTERIATARNACVKIAKIKYAEFDYIAVADLDFANYDLTKQALMSCWRFEGWDMLSANQEIYYYDIWALREPTWSPGDCWHEYDQIKLKVGYRKAFAKAIQSKRKRITKNTGLIPVESAFGGLAIYKSEAYFSGAYSGLDEYGESICEHVPFNQILAKRGYKLFINPELINQGFKRQIAEKLIFQFSKFKTTNKDLSPFN